MTPAAKRIQGACNRLALAKVKMCRRVPASGVPHKCSFCDQPIRTPALYREKGPSLRAHNDCFLAVARDYTVAARLKDMSRWHDAQKDTSK
jgi:hypothetical protein